VLRVGLILTTIVSKYAWFILGMYQIAHSTLTTTRQEPWSSIYCVELRRRWEGSSIGAGGEEEGGYGVGFSREDIPEEERCGTFLLRIRRRRRLLGPERVMTEELVHRRYPHLSACQLRYLITSSWRWLTFQFRSLSTPPFLPVCVHVQKYSVHCKCVFRKGRGEGLTNIWKKMLSTVYDRHVIYLKVHESDH
jgi:hypothetical protein